MRIVKRRIGELIEMPDNPRIGDLDFYEDLKKSLREYGYVIPIIVNSKTMHVIGGNQRLKVLREMYGDDYEVEVVEVDLDEKDEKELNILLNSTKGRLLKERLKEFVGKEFTNRYNFAKIKEVSKKYLYTIDFVFDDEDEYLFVKKRIRELKEQYGCDEGEALYRYVRDKYGSGKA